MRNSNGLLSAASLPPGKARLRRQLSRSPCRGVDLYGTARLGVVPTTEEVTEALKGVEDPELGMDVVDLGLVYEVQVDGPKVKVVHSLTSMGCPAGPMIQEGIHDAAAAVPGVENVEVELTWDPPWTPELMSEDAKFILGFG
jgi:metal-sulfur cluster biosynthetic enzyme